MANTVYDNFVLESKLKDILTTKLDTKTLMTIDDSLTESAGMIKKINTYTYTGAVERLDKGSKNTTRGSISYTTAPYTVKVAQEVFDYYDEEFMQDPHVLDFGLEGAAQLMVNHMTSDYFTEIAKATLNQTYAHGGSISYDTVVDAIALMNIEDESGLFLLVGNDLKAQIRKDADFKSKELGKVIADGAVGTLSGVPVICSKAVPAKTAYLATREAVTLFTKKDNEVEQERDGETRKNTVIMRKVNLVALTDATKVVKITEATA